MAPGYAEAVLKRDRAFVIAGLGGIAKAFVIAGLGGIAGISWVYIFHLARNMGTATGMEMGVPRMQGWGAVGGAAYSVTAILQ